jgi:hypothetical protein
MEELKELCQEVDAYDSHLKYQFNLRAAYLWSIYNYLAYDKFIGWCVHGRLNCPICMDDSGAFRLEHGKKITFFDCHQRFIPLNQLFRSDRRSFLKDKPVRKGSPKRKFRANIMKTLDDLKCQKIVSSKVTVKITTGLIKVAFENSLMQKH